MRWKGTSDVTRCLLIDEDKASAKRLQALLADLGLETDQAAAPDEALRHCNATAPDIVMLSAAASASQPRDFVRKLRRSNAGKTPVVILYAKTPDTQMISQSILQGAADVLMQPFDRDILQFKLRQAGIAV